MSHDQCFEQKYENSQKHSSENCHFFSCDKSLYIAWACFRNGPWQYDNLPNFEDSISSMKLRNLFEKSHRHVFLFEVKLISLCFREASTKIALS